MTDNGADISAAIRHCRDLTRRAARNFYYALKVSPEPQRSALYVIYAWMRRADDLADAAGGDPMSRRPAVEAFRQKTDAALAGHAAENDPMWVAMVETASMFNLPREALHAMLDGQLDDLADRRYKTFDELREYCYRVASTVGLVCIEVWGYTNERARELAIDRGIAFQLTNILRDFAQDYDAGRVYLPMEDFDRHSLSHRQLRIWFQSSMCERFVLEQVERAEMYYLRSQPLEAMITPACRPTLWAMSRIYQGLLAKIKRAPSIIAGPKRVRLSSLHKGAIAFRAKRMVARSVAKTQHAFENGDHDSTDGASAPKEEASHESAHETSEAKAGDGSDST